MKIEERFKLILEQAVKYGWDICGFLAPNNCDNWQEGIHQWQGVVDLEIYAYGKKRVISLDTIIFDHDFAKAYWGDENHNYCIICPDSLKNPLLSPTMWEIHLKQLVIIPTAERIDYLERFLHD